MRGTMWLAALGCGILLSSGCCGFLQNGGCGRGCGYQSSGSCDGDCPTCGPAGGPVRQRIYGNRRLQHVRRWPELRRESRQLLPEQLLHSPLPLDWELVLCRHLVRPKLRQHLLGRGGQRSAGLPRSVQSQRPMDRSQRLRKLQSGRDAGESGNMPAVPEGAMLEDDPQPEPTLAPQAPTKAMRRPAADSYDR